MSRAKGGLRVPHTTSIVLPRPCRLERRRYAPPLPSVRPSGRKAPAFLNTPARHIVTGVGVAAIQPTGAKFRELLAAAFLTRLPGDHAEGAWGASEEELVGAAPSAAVCVASLACASTASW